MIVRPHNHHIINKILLITCHLIKILFFIISYFYNHKNLILTLQLTSASFSLLYHPYGFTHNWVTYIKEMIEVRSSFCKEVESSVFSFLTDNKWHEVYKYGNAFLVRREAEIDGPIPSTPSCYQNSPLPPMHDIIEYPLSPFQKPLSTQVQCLDISDGRKVEIPPEVAQFRITGPATELLGFKKGRMYIRKADRISKNIKPSLFPEELVLTETIKSKHGSFHTATVIHKPPISMSLHQMDNEMFDEIELTESRHDIDNYRKIAHWILTTERREVGRDPKHKTVEAIMPTLGIGWTCHAHGLISPESRTEYTYRRALKKLLYATGISSAEELHRLMNNYVLKIFKRVALTKRAAEYILNQYIIAELLHIHAGINLFRSKTDFFQVDLPDNTTEFVFFSVQKRIPEEKFAHIILTKLNKSNKEQSQSTDIDYNKGTRKIINGFLQIIQQFRYFKSAMPGEWLRLGFDANWKNAALDDREELGVIDFSPPQLEYSGNLTQCYKELNGPDNSQPWVTITRSLYEVLAQICYIIAKIFMDAGDAEHYLNKYHIPKDDNNKYLKAFCYFMDDPCENSMTQLALDFAVEKDWVRQEIGFFLEEAPVLPYNITSHPMDNPPQFHKYLSHLLTLADVPQENRKAVVSFNQPPKRCLEVLTASLIEQIKEMRLQRGDKVDTVTELSLNNCGQEDITDWEDSTDQEDITDQEDNFNNKEVLATTSLLPPAESSCSTSITNEGQPESNVPTSSPLMAADANENAETPMDSDEDYPSHFLDAEETTSYFEQLDQCSPKEATPFQSGASKPTMVVHPLQHTTSSQEDFLHDVSRGLSNIVFNNTTDSDDIKDPDLTYALNQASKYYPPYAIKTISGNSPFIEPHKIRNISDHMLPLIKTFFRTHAIPVQVDPSTQPRPPWHALPKWALGENFHPTRRHPNAGFLRTIELSYREMSWLDTAGRLKRPSALFLSYLHDIKRYRSSYINFSLFPADYLEPLAHCTRLSSQKYTRSSQHRANHIVIIDLSFLFHNHDEDVKSTFSLYTDSGTYNNLYFTQLTPELTIEHLKITLNNENTRIFVLVTLEADNNLSTHRNIPGNSQFMFKGEFTSPSPIKMEVTGQPVPEPQSNPLLIGRSASWDNSYSSSIPKSPDNNDHRAMLEGSEELRADNIAEAFNLSPTSTVDTTDISLLSNLCPQSFEPIFSNSNNTHYSKKPDQLYYWIPHMTYYIDIINTIRSTAHLNSAFISNKNIYDLVTNIDLPHFINSLKMNKKTSCLATVLIAYAISNITPTEPDQVSIQQNIQQFLLALPQSHSRYTQFFSSRFSKSDYSLGFTDIITRLTCPDLSLHSESKSWDIIRECHKLLYQALILTNHVIDTGNLLPVIRDYLPMVIATSDSLCSISIVSGTLFLLLMNTINQIINSSGDLSANGQQESSLHQVIKSFLPDFSKDLRSPPIPVCCLCMHPSSNEISAKDHLLRHTAKTYCGNCSFAIDENESYCICPELTSIPTAYNERGLRCLQCHKVYFCDTHLRAHTCLHRSNTVKDKGLKYHCIYCFNSFTYSRELHTHIRCCHPQSTGMEQKNISPFLKPAPWEKQPLLHYNHYRERPYDGSEAPGKSSSWNYKSARRLSEPYTH
ncbi:hypothetical protein [Endozoicomonas sp. Mp262]|uniref:hypothetical protein n=1 Tax=Endozoicomonas sp. Mp262 TaxID=2919499 RepID=UPI0021D854EE